MCWIRNGKYLELELLGPFSGALPSCAAWGLELQREKTKNKKTNTSQQKTHKNNKHPQFLRPPPPPTAATISILTIAERCPASLAWKAAGKLQPSTAPTITSCACSVGEWAGIARGAGRVSHTLRLRYARCKWYEFEDWGLFSFVHIFLAHLFPPPFLTRTKRLRYMPHPLTKPCPPLVP